MQRYSMMKETFVCTVGTKLKKHHKRNEIYSLREFHIKMYESRGVLKVLTLAVVKKMMMKKKRLTIPNVN
jgi:hypothetical protein